MNPIDINMNILAKAMSLRLERHAAIAGNIANADTPGYRPSQVSFEGELQKAASKKSLDQLEHISGKKMVIDDGTPRLDGNSVNVDKQMAAMTENSICYNATAEFLTKRIKMLKSVIG